MSEVFGVGSEDDVYVFGCEWRILKDCCDFVDDDVVYFVV